ncbi:MAG: hypothetical protein WCK47_13415 [bacterium]|nr:hypothetical protein [Candidatus Sumerlaeota bacterium]
MNLKTHADSRRGGATFTMLLFFLLIVSSGLMYFYFMRCRNLERELERWRAGMKTREDVQLVTTTKEPPPPPVPVKDKTLGMPAPAVAKLPDSAAPSTQQTHAAPFHDLSIAEDRQKIEDKRVTLPPRQQTDARQKTPAKPASAEPRRESKPRSTPIASAYDLPASDDGQASSQQTGGDQAKPRVRVSVPRRTPAPGRE